MNLMELGAIGELVGGVAVLATLIYLAAQVRQNTRYTHRTVYGSAARDCSDWMMELARDGELSQIYHRGLRTPDALSPEELYRFNDTLGAFFTLLEGFYLHNLEFKEIESQKRWATVIKRVLGLPGGQSFWERGKWMYNPRFTKYIESQCLATLRETR